MDEQPNDEIVHRDLDPGQGDPVGQVTDVVAELDGKRHSELKPAYDHLDHVITYVFENPPVPEAQVQITFSYEGYRITVEQDGSTKFVKTD